MSEINKGLTKHNEVVQTEHPISAYVRVETQVLATASADAYRAFDLAQKQSCCLWLGREVFTPNSKEVLDFLRRFEAIDSIDPSICVIAGYGVDADGRAFALFAPLDGYKVTGGNLEGAEVERRFTACLRLIAILHENGINCGDISADSFWVTRDGEVIILGLMGALFPDSKKAFSKAPVSALSFIAPEIFLGQSISGASDVYSLGVLAYHLLTHSFPFGAEGLKRYIGSGSSEPLAYKPVSKCIGNPPVWADELIAKSLALNPKDRFTSAKQMLDAMQDIRQRVTQNEAMPVLREKAKTTPQLITSHPTEYKRAQDAMLPSHSQNDNVSLPLQKSQVFVIGALILVLLTLAIIFIPSFFGADTQKNNVGRLQDGLEPLLDIVSDEPLADDISALVDVNKDLKAKEEYLEKMARSNDPIAHSALITSAKEAPNEQFRAASEKAILERSTRLGLLRASEQGRQWLRTLRPKEYPPSYEAILKVLDISLPLEEQFSSIRQAYSSNPIVALRMAAALAFDLEALPRFQPLLSQLIGDSLRLDDANNYSAISLIMAHQDLSLVFGEDVLQHREQVPDTDLSWLLKRLSVQRDIHVRAIANLALERSVLPPIRALFLEIVRDRADLPASVITALVRGAAGSLEEEDIASFGRWYDTQSENVLLAGLVDIQDKKLARLAVEALAGKSVSREPVASIIKWVKEAYWEEREKFSKLIGVLGHLDRAGDKLIIETLDLLDQVVRDTDLLDILLETNNPIVVRTVVTKYGDLLGLGTLLTLLSNSDKDVRIEAIRALKDFNDLGALKIIVDHYEQEKSEEVRAIYRKTFWVIQRREKGEGGLLD